VKLIFTGAGFFELPIRSKDRMNERETETDWLIGKVTSYHSLQEAIYFHAAIPGHPNRTTVVLSASNTRMRH